MADDNQYNPAASIQVTGLVESSYTPSDLVKRNWYLNESFNGKPSLKESVTSLKWQDEVAESIRVNMEQGLKLTSLTKEIANYSTEEDIAGWVRQIEAQARTVMAGDMTHMDELQSAIKAAKKEIIVEGDESATAMRGVRLARAYQRVVTAAENLSEEGLDKAIETAIEKKTLYNAFRIATTEANRAYNLGVYTRAVNDEDCEAIQIDLSSAGGSCDECEEITEQDNGAGPGIYSRDQCPELPIHPNCVLPGNRVWFEGKLVGACKSFYCGFVEQVTLMSGKKFTVTINHPVLTSRGWVKAKELTKRDQVISCYDKKRSLKIKNVFRMVRKKGSIVYCGKVVADAFHQDGTNIDNTLAYALPNDFYLNCNSGEPSERLNKYDFLHFLKRQYDLRTFLRLLLVENTIDMFRCLGHKFFANRLIQKLFPSPLLACGAFYQDKKDASFGKNFVPPRDDGADVQCQKYVDSVLSSFVQPHEVYDSERSECETASARDRGLFSCDLSHNTPNTSQDTSNVYLGDKKCKLPCYKNNTTTGKSQSNLYQTEQIIKIKSYNYYGYVYDLQIEPTHTFLCNGVIVKNCRCIANPVFVLPKGVSEDDLEVDDPDFDTMEAMPDDVAGE